MHADFWAKNRERPVYLPHAFFPPQLEVDDAKVDVTDAWVNRGFQAGLSEKVPSEPRLDDLAIG